MIPLPEPTTTEPTKSQVGPEPKTRVLRYIDLWPAKAIKDYSRLIELDSNYVDAYVIRGQAYSNTGCYDRAKQDFIRAIELGDPYANDRLIEMQRGLNQ